MIYNGEVSIESKHLKKFKWFVEVLLEVNLQENENDCSAPEHQEMVIPRVPDTLTENDENVQEEPEVSDTDTTNVSTQDKRKEMPAKISSFISPVKTNEKNSSNKEITSSDLSNWTLTTVNDKELNQIRHALLPSASGKGRNLNFKICICYIFFVFKLSFWN